MDWYMDEACKGSNTSQGPLERILTKYFLDGWSVRKNMILNCPCKYVPHFSKELLGNIHEFGLMRLVKQLHHWIPRRDSRPSISELTGYLVN
jgi:hypothetical protein